MLPLISVLIPVYEVEEYLDRCVQSVLAQTYENFEVVMVDDGSKDRSAEIASRYAEEYENIRLVRSEHAGVSHARNLLLENAKGEYVFFLDSDDFIDPETLQMLYDLAVKYDADITQGKMFRTQTDGYTANKLENPDIYIITSFAKMVEAWHQNIVQTMVMSKLYNRKVLEHIVFPSGKIHEDEAVMHHILSNVKKMVCIMQPLYYYYRNTKSIMNRAFNYTRYDALDALQDRIDFFDSLDMGFDADMAALRYCFVCVELYRRTVQEIDANDSHLKMLYENLERNATRVLNSGRFDEDLQSHIKSWLQDPLRGEMPYYWPIASAYYTAHGKESNT